jgi:hypothetical protein
MFLGGLQWLAIKVGYNLSAYKSDEDKSEDEGANKGKVTSDQILRKHRSQSKAEKPDSDRVFLVKAFQESVKSERGRNYRNSLPKLRQYLFNKSNASQVFAFAFFWVSAHT